MGIWKVGTGRDGALALWCVTCAENDDRRYHTYRIGRYPLPNDDDEFKREYLRHVMLKHLLNNELYLAPIGNNPQKIIDLGTGFGDWAMDGTLSAIHIVSASHDIINPAAVKPLVLSWQSAKSTRALG